MSDDREASRVLQGREQAVAACREEAEDEDEGGLKPGARLRLC